MSALSVSILRRLASKIESINADIIHQAEDAALVALYETRGNGSGMKAEGIIEFMQNRFGRTIEPGDIRCYYAAAKQRMEKKLAQANQPDVLDSVLGSVNGNG